MKLICIRHGNTFLQGEPPRWIGAKEDFPLTDEGHAQGIALGHHFKNQSIIPDVWYTSTLKRTKAFAHTIQIVLGATPTTEHPSLDELDYGSWGGRTTPDIIETFGLEALENWENKSLIPPQWTTQEDLVLANIDHFLETLKRTHPLTHTIGVVTSNGVLRFLLKYIAPALFEEKLLNHTLKTKTAHYGVIDHGVVIAWNVGAH
jgi:broad specificity phosphatase PhoE